MAEASFYDSPECIIYCNSQFLDIKNWLEKVRSLDINDERNILRVDISFTRAKLFNSLIKNLPAMFPKDILDYELSTGEGENHNEMYLIIKRTTEEKRK